MVDAVYIGNLDHSTTEEELLVLFKPFGEVISTRFIRDFGLVKLESKKTMKLAAAKLNKVNLKGKLLNVSCAIERKS